MILARLRTIRVSRAQTVTADGTLGTLNALESGLAPTRLERATSLLFG